MAIRTHHGVKHVEISYAVDYARRLRDALCNLPIDRDDGQDSLLGRLRDDLTNELHKYDERVKAAERIKEG